MDRTVVYLLCGLPGSGKTTYARKLEQERGAVRMGLDAWMIRLFGHHMPRDVFEERIRSCQAIMLELTERLAARGIDVVLDWGFGSRAHRLETTQRLRKAGAQPQLVYFEASRETLQQRLATRNAALPADTYEITDALLDYLAMRHEPPTDDEAPHRIDTR